MRRALSMEKVVDTRESPHFLLSPKKLGFATREAIFVATPIQSSILHQIDDVVRSHRAEYGVPRRCACGGRIIDEVRGKEDYDSLPGKRFLTCVNYEDDGLHYRHPWVVGVQEKIKMLSKRLDEAEQVMKGVWKLNKRIEDLEVQVTTLSEHVDYLTVEVGTLEKVCFD
ncbi:hypothetical protein Bca52824_092471 [Brassica carinata]|uniref:Uncharacterized protein n=1 Tax=Brassica carinata TaxID=52824 RepID=A0A8X7TE36_BRACI|nr:hypothetical protein Bca52824_092471 [Brassica carinata]